VAARISSIPLSNIPTRSATKRSGSRSPAATSTGDTRSPSSRTCTSTATGAGRSETPDGRLFASPVNEYEPTNDRSEDDLWEIQELSVGGSENGDLNRFVLAFGRDHDDELYVLTTARYTEGETGEVYRIVPEGEGEEIEEHEDAVGTEDQAAEEGESEDEEDEDDQAEEGGEEAEETEEEEADESGNETESETGNETGDDE